MIKKPNCTILLLEPCGFAVQISCHLRGLQKQEQQGFVLGDEGRQLIYGFVEHNWLAYIQDFNYVLTFEMTKKL
jgi:hypothetical protein